MTALPLPARDRSLLEACLRDGQAVRDAFAAWRPFAHPAAMRGRELRLMPLLLANLDRAGVDDPCTTWLRGQAKHIWLTSALRMRTMHAWLDALAAADIPVVLVKGTALLARWRHEVETRPMGDFDLLVPRPRAIEAIAIARATGCRGPAPHLITDDDLRRIHALGLTDRTGTTLDLHWRPAEAIVDPDHAVGVMARAVEVRIGPRAVRAASLSDHLFVLLAHAFHDTVIERHDWVAEAALLFRLGSADDWDWPLFRSLCRRYRLELWARRALTLVEEISGRPLPDGAPRATRVRPDWTWPWQQREIARRGRPVTGRLDRIARRAGETARGRRAPVEDDLSWPLERLVD